MDKMEVSSHTGIKPCVIEEIRALAERHHIQQVILFGSRARGDYGRASDIDLAVKGGEFTEFALDLEEETSTLLKFDVVNLDAKLQRQFVYTILREGVVIYEKVS